MWKKCRLDHFRTGKRLLLIRGYICHHRTYSSLRTSVSGTCHIRYMGLTSHSVLMSPLAYRPLTCITSRMKLKSMSQRRTYWYCSWFVQVQQPVLIRSTPLSKLWYKPDTKFRMPKAYIQLHFSCPETYHTPETSVLTHIFTKLLVDYLNEYGKKFVTSWEIEVIVSSLDDCAYCGSLHSLLDHSLTTLKMFLSHRMLEIGTTSTISTLNPKSLLFISRFESRTFHNQDSLMR